jgi:hypothetical protein
VPPLEVHTHTAIYRARPDVAAIVHAHAMMVTAFTMAGRTVEPVYARGVESTGDELPTFESPDPIGTPELGEQLAAALGTQRACDSQSRAGDGRLVEGAALAAINLGGSHAVDRVALGTPAGCPTRRSRSAGRSGTIRYSALSCGATREATAARPAVRLRTVGRLASSASARQSATSFKENNVGRSPTCVINRPPHDDQFRVYGAGPAPDARQSICTMRRVPRRIALAQLAAEDRPERQAR